MKSARKALFALSFALVILWSSGSALHAQFTIRSFTIDGGGGRSAGGDFRLDGTIGQPDAAPPISGGAFTFSGGFWATETTLPGGGYAAWAAANIAPGLDASFDGDANQDGIANGLVYVFGDLGVGILGKGIVTAPPPVIPVDVILELEASTDLLDWTTVLKYEGGVQTLIHPDLSIMGTMLIDAGSALKRFYRYRVTLIP